MPFIHMVLVLSNLALVRIKVKEAVKCATHLLTAESEEEAWVKLMQNNDINFALLDDNMPENDGMKLLSKIREKGLEIPVVMFGDKVDSKRVIHCFELGADDYVEYSISAELLRAKIHVIMRRS